VTDSITAERLAEIRARAQRFELNRRTIVALLAAIAARDEEIERLRGEPTDAEVAAGAWAMFLANKTKYLNEDQYESTWPNVKQSYVALTRAALTAAREVRPN
jgi:hypothetical protein